MHLFKYCLWGLSDALLIGWMNFYGNLLFLCSSGCSMCHVLFKRTQNTHFLKRRSTPASRFVPRDYPHTVVSLLLASLPKVHVILHEVKGCTGSCDNRPYPPTI